jgi:hypothetical protein
MSTLATNAITDASGGNTATINSYTPTESNMAGRNRIINGSMVLDQRNAGAAITLSGSGQFIVDRMKCRLDASSSSTGQQSSTVPVGFSNSVVVTIGTGAAPTSGQLGWFSQGIEGYNIADLAWGTADAKAVTLSFWVRSSVTGTFSGALRNSAGDRSYVFEYTVNTANTWEQKSVTIAGETSGTWLTTNGPGAYLFFNMGTGSTYLTTAGAWSAGGYFGSTGSTSLCATSGATFYITGVQLEAGSVATPFEHRQYGQELALCQRYFIKYYSSSPTSLYYRYCYGECDTTTSFLGGIYFPVVMRISPTLTASGSFAVYSASAITSVSVSLDVNSIEPTGVNMSCSGSGFSTGNGGCLISNNNTSTSLSFSAEL